MTTPFHAQRAKLRSLKEKQDHGEFVEPDQRITPKAKTRRAAEALAAPTPSKKKSKKKTSASSTD